MWKGRALEIIGLWLIVAAFLNHTPDTTGVINLITGGVAAILGASLRKSKTWQGLVAGIAGAILFAMAFVPALRAHEVNLWVDIIGGVVIWFSGWRVVASEMGGPWRLKDGPVFDSPVPQNHREG